MFSLIQTTKSVAAKNFHIRIYLTHTSLSPIESLVDHISHDMAPQSEPEIVLYDLACTKNVCFSPVVWRIRLMLNYKRIPYRTVFLEFPDIERTLKGL
jgi:hypothetical protein